MSSSIEPTLTPDPKTITILSLPHTPPPVIPKRPSLAILQPVTSTQELPSFPMPGSYPNSTAPPLPPKVPLSSVEEETPNSVWQSALSSLPPPSPETDPNPNPDPETPENNATSSPPTHPSNIKNEETVRITVSPDKQEFTISKTVCEQIPFIGMIFDASTPSVVTTHHLTTLLRIPSIYLPEFRILISWAETNILSPMTVPLVPQNPTQENQQLNGHRWAYNPIHLSFLTSLLSLSALNSLVLTELHQVYLHTNLLTSLEHVKLAFEITPPEGRLCVYMSRLLAWIILASEEVEGSPFSNREIGEVLGSSEELRKSVLGWLRGRCVESTRGGEIVGKESAVGENSFLLGGENSLEALEVDRGMFEVSREELEMVAFRRVQEEFVLLEQEAEKEIMEAVLEERRMRAEEVEGKGKGKGKDE